MATFDSRRFQNEFSRDTRCGLRHTGNPMNPGSLALSPPLPPTSYPASAGLIGFHPDKINYLANLLMMRFVVGCRPSIFAQVLKESANMTPPIEWAYDSEFMRRPPLPPPGFYIRIFLMPPPPPPVDEDAVQMDKPDEYDKPSRKRQRDWGP